MKFSEWMSYEAERIYKLGMKLPDEHREDYIKVQIIAALNKAFAHGRDGLSVLEEPRANVTE